MEKKLGKITCVRVGSGGYQDAMFGITVELRFDGRGSQTFEGFWQTYPERASYTKDEWHESQLSFINYLQKLMSDAKVDDVTRLVGKPVEVSIESMTVKSWRILTEVL